MAAMSSVQPSRLTMGPVLFNWHPETWRDFYFRVADEADVDTVCVGEVVCAKRAPLFRDHLPDVIERLQAAGKEIVLSSLALIMSPQELKQMQALTGDEAFLIEANDISVASLLAGRPHAIGPFVSAFNEGTIAVLARRGAARICLPVEMSGPAIARLMDGLGKLMLAGPDDPAPGATRPEIEVMAFGRLPLAISARCYHARNHGLHKDNCRYVCGEDADGLAVETLDGEKFLAINGLQTLSSSYLNLAAEMPVLKALGVSRFRLSPHSFDMVAVAAVFRALLDDRISADEAGTRLRTITGNVDFCNGYFHAREGHALGADSGPDLPAHA